MRWWPFFAVMWTSHLYFYFQIIQIYLQKYSKLKSSEAWVSIFILTATFALSMRTQWNRRRFEYGGQNQWHFINIRTTVIWGRLSVKVAMVGESPDLMFRNGKSINYRGTVENFQSSGMWMRAQRTHSPSPATSKANGCVLVSKSIEFNSFPLA